jgi:pentatricopeptide repeat domain-containing protein 1
VKELLQIVKLDKSLVTEICNEVKERYSIRGVENAKEAMNIISLYKIDGDVTSAIHLLNKLINDPNTKFLDTAIFNNLIDLCAKQKNVAMVIYILQRMESLGINKDKITYGSALSACANSGKWELALKLLDQMMKRNIQPDTICYSSAISACSRSGQLKEALQLLKSMKEKNIRTDAIVYNSILVACNKNNEGDIAQQIIHMMRSERIKLDAYTYTAVLSSCDKSKSFDKIIQYTNEMIEENLFSNVIPYNLAIRSLACNNRVSDAINIYNNICRLSVPLNAYTYSSLFSSLAKENNWLKITQLVSDMENLKIQPNPIIYKYIIAAFEKMKYYELANQYFENMKNNHFIPSTSIYNVIILCRGHTHGYDSAYELFEEMSVNNIPRNTLTYNNMILCCRLAGKHEKAISLLREMSQIANISSSNSTSGLDKIVSKSTEYNDTINFITSYDIKPDTVTYSSCIAVCVDSKQWGLALDLLYEMETLGIPRTIITYNTVIEALTFAGESVRSELVYQSALRSCIYSHWHPTYNTHPIIKNKILSNQPPSERFSQSINGLLPPDTETLSRTESDEDNMNNVQGESSITDDIFFMDLHRFPISVAQAAIIHVLGEICTNVIPIPKELVIITGLGHHIPSAKKYSPKLSVESISNRRGLLGKQIFSYLSHLGLDPGYGVKNIKSQRFDNQLSDSINQYNDINRGRVVISRESISKWLAAQKQDDNLKKSSGSSVHGNIFLQVARAKTKMSFQKKNNVDIRAVCPFSSAKIPLKVLKESSDPLIVEDAKMPVEMASNPAEIKSGKCPAHASVINVEDAKIPVEMASNPTEIKSTQI